MIVVSGAITIANRIAHMSELIGPISIFLGLTRQNLVTQSLCYVFRGEGRRGSWSTRSYSNTGSGHPKTMCAL